MPSYTEITKPVPKNYLLNQTGGFLLFQDGSQINIGGENFEEISKPSYITFMLQEDRYFILQEDGFKIELTDNPMTEIGKPSAPIYTEITRPT